MKIIKSKYRNHLTNRHLSDWLSVAKAYKALGQHSVTAITLTGNMTATVWLSDGIVKSDAA